MRDKKGFTLLEVMVAITVLSFILGIVYTTFATISESGRRGAALLESDVKVRNLAEYLMRDLSSLIIDLEHPPVAGKATGLIYGLVGSRLDEEGTRLDFTALSTDSGDFRDAVVTEIGYYLLPTEGGSFRLMKRIDETPDDNIEEGGHSFEIMEGLSSLSLRV